MNAGAYNNPSEFEADIHLMLANAMTYVRPGPRLFLFFAVLRLTPSLFIFLAERGSQRESFFFLQS